MNSGHFIVIFILLVFISSLFFVTAQEVNTSNNSNLTNQTKTMAGLDNPSAQKNSVSILIKTPNVDLGTRIPDGSEKAYPNAVSLDLSSDADSDLSVMCDGNLTSADNTSNTISLNNFKYDGFNNASLSKRAFTTTYSHVKSWNGNITVPVNLYLIVPFGTQPGTYSSTIYYMVS